MIFDVKRRILNVQFDSILQMFVNAITAIGIIKCYL